MLEIKNLTYSYSRKRPPVLSNLSLDIDAGGIYGLLGQNGAGKSTLLYLIAGVLTPQVGTIILNGVATRKRLPATLSDIFLVPEEFTLPPVTLDEYVRVNARFYPRFSRDDLRRHISTFGLDTDMNLGSLSMGQKKKAFMCFALAANTPLLLMDEPTNGLDIPGKTAFRRFMASAMDSDRAVIISTHQVRDVERLIDRVLIVNSGQVVFNRTQDEIAAKLRFLETDDASLKAKALFSRPSLSGNQIVIPNDGVTETAVNLELLFELSLSDRETLNTIFSTRNETNHDNGNENID